jgi:hypothetical protein
MSTRSAIITKQPDGTYAGIYCHFDGYVEGVGKMLLDHYQDAEKVSQLVALGDISTLGRRVSPVGPHSFRSPEDGTTVAYMRDRGETGCPAKTGATVNEVASSIGHVYVFEDGAWTHNGYPLSDELKEAESNA